MTKIQNPNHAAGMNNRWRYAGKEEQRFGLAGAFSPAANAPFSGSGSLDLSLLDFGARMYDPFVARWTAVDPLAKNYSSYSSLVFCGSNPVSNFELDGNIWDTAFDIAMVTYDLGAAAVQKIKGNNEKASLHMKDAGADLICALIPGVPAGGTKLIRLIDKTIDVARVGSESLKAFQHAGEFGIDSYKALKKAVQKSYGKNSGLEVHHLIEQRLSGALDLNASEIPSIVLTHDEHKAFTKEWRNLLPYGTDYSTVSRESVLEIARKVYADSPELLAVIERFLQ